MTAPKTVILTLSVAKGKDLEINRCGNLRSFVVYATQDNGGIDSTITLR